MMKYITNILSTQPDDTRVDKFVKYFVDTYYEGPNFEFEMCNHFETVNLPRTKNNLEGYNNKLSNHLSVSHPDIFKDISKFKEEETDASLIYYRAINNEKATPRKKLNVINDAILNNNRQMLLDSEISIDTYSKYVSMMFDLNALDKKKNKIQQDAHDNDISTASEYESDEIDIREFDN
ncbi:unnamed protein product [Brachionus calyciflorus]|uniref:Uncharacterized protein n=1 Tax=Brachionus calyciflorus TaxID=104777 RepID=A0A814A2M4_9BILA|nr:unnamed protein product [Brachionus calyciflorus]